MTQWRGGKEDQLMPAGSFVIGEGHVVDMQPSVDGEVNPSVHPLYQHLYSLNSKVGS
jgi:hypothetical protein